MYMVQKFESRVEMLNFMKLNPLIKIKKVQKGRRRIKLFCKPCSG